ncbi:MAG: hypothetical protein ACKOCH_06555 [Bacteroidota bacterium]
MFDVEFSAKRISTPVYTLLWLFLGSFGAHAAYSWMKTGKPPAIFGYVLGLIWARVLSSSPKTAEQAEIVLFIAVIIHGIFIFASGTLKEMNNGIAKSVAATIKA